jgi:hypothetical protein
MPIPLAKNINLSFNFKSGEKLSAEQFLGGVELGSNEVVVEYMTEETVLRYDYENSNWEGMAYKFIKFSPDSAIDYSRIENGIPVLKDHGSDSVENLIGSVVRADSRFMLLKIDDGSVEGKEVLRKIKDGFWNSVSVGLEVLEQEEIGTMLLGKDEWPVFEVTKHRPYELSFVAVPALMGAKVVSLSQFEENFKENFKENLQIQTRALSSEIEPIEESKTMEPDELKKLELAKQEELANAAKRENLRQQTIRSYASELSFNDSVSLNKLLDDTSVTPEKAKLEIFEALRKAQPVINPVGAAPAVETKLAERNNSEKFAKAIEDRLARNSTETELMYYSFTELMLEFLRSNGVGKFGSAKGNELAILKTAYSVGKENLAHSSADFNTLLVSSANRLLEDGLVAANPTYQMISRADGLKDLKQKTYVGTDLIGNLIKRTENGQFVRTTLTESSKSLKPDSFGNEIQISEEMLINDDLGAFVEVALEFAAALQRTRNNLVYGVLSAETFGVTRSTAANADETGLSALRAFFRKYTITTHDKKIITLNPRMDIIVAPVALEAALGKVLYGTILANQVSNVNGFTLGNAINNVSTKLVTDAELDNASLVDFYGMQNPNAGRPALRHAYYQGAPNGRILNYFEDKTRSIVFQVVDYFAAMVASQDTIVKADNT